MVKRIQLIRFLLYIDKGALISGTINRSLYYCGMGHLKKVSPHEKGCSVAALFLTPYFVI